MVDNQDIKGRLCLYIKHLGIGQSRFEKICGLSNAYVNNIRVSISPKKLQQISQHFPELNTGWLMTGEGKMLKTDTIIQSIGDNSTNNTQVAGTQELAVIQERIKHLEGIIKEKEALIDEKERMIQVLLKR